MLNFSSYGIIVICVLISPFIITAYDECNPAEHCRESYAGKKVKDPDNCHNYYICIKDKKGDVVPSDQPFECDDGYSFEPYNRLCHTSSCDETCPKICNLTCTNYAYEKIPDPVSCSIFYVCKPDHSKILHRCPSTAPYFNGTECSEYKFECCDVCTPPCKESYTEALDPYDCRSYYYCPYKGVSDYSNHFECDEGKFFDPTIGTCEYENSSNSCHDICSDFNATDTNI